jgi:hypothetical protein
MVRSLVGNGLAPISEVIADAWWHSCYLKQPSSAIHLIFFPATFFENLSCLGFTRFSLSSLFWKKKQVELEVLKNLENQRL